MTNKPQFVGEKIAFSDAFVEVSRGVKKIKQKDYLPAGDHPIIDQGQDAVSGYACGEEGLFSDVPAIVFGDHTRCVKYVSEPFFAGADGVKILRPKQSDNVRFWWHALRTTRIENLGYSRHFKLLKESRFANYDEQDQRVICENLDRIMDEIDLASRQLAALDSLVKSRFVEMFESNEPNGFIPLRECCSKICGGKTPSMKRPEYYGGDIPFVKSGDIKQDSVSSGSLALTAKAVEETGVKIVPKNSVLVVTRSAMLHRKMHSSINTRELAINQDIKAFIPSPSYLPSYLLWAIRSHEQELLAGVRSVSTCALDFNQLCSIRIRKASVQEQQEFADFVAQVDKSRFLHQASAKVRGNKLQSSFTSDIGSTFSRRLSLQEGLTLGRKTRR